MKKQDLFKKIEIFEKIATFGSRKSFLSAIAQGSVLTPELQQELDNFIQTLQMAEGNESPIAQKLTEAKNSSNLDEILSLVDQAKVLYNTRAPNGPEFNEAVSLYDKLKQPRTQSKNMGYEKIDPLVQQALHYLGAPVYLKIDGILGQKTRAALDWFKEKENITSDAEAFEKAKEAFARIYPGTKLEIDPNYNPEPLKALNFDPEMGARPVPGPLPNPIEYYIDKYKNQT